MCGELIDIGRLMSKLNIYRLYGICAKSYPLRLISFTQFLFALSIVLGCRTLFVGFRILFFFVASQRFSCLVAITWCVQFSEYY